MSIETMERVWRHSRSKGLPRLVLLAIADCAKPDGSGAFPSMAELRRKTGGMDERTVQRSIASLVEIGELVVERGGGRGRANLYRVTVKAETPAEMPPITEETPAENTPISAGVTAINTPIPAPVSTETPAVKPPISAGVTAETPADMRENPGRNGGPTVRNQESSLTESSTPGGDTKRATKRTTAAPRTRIPDDFLITSAMVAWAGRECPDVNVRRETEIFVAYWRGKGGTGSLKADWPQTWKVWLLKEQKQAEQRRPAARPPGQMRHDNADRAANRKRYADMDARKQGPLAVEGGWG